MAGCGVGGVVSSQEGQKVLREVRVATIYQFLNYWAILKVVHCHNTCVSCVTLSLLVISSMTQHDQGHSLPTS